MPIRLSGINSGLDTDAIIKELVSAYRVKTDNMKKQQTKLEWKQDAWKALNTKIYKLYSTTMTCLKNSAAYNKKKTTVSDETKASVVAANGAVNGSQTLKVENLAKAGYLTGGVVRRAGASADRITTSSTLGDMGVTDGSSITLTKGDGSSTTLNLTADMKVSDFVTELKAAGVSANFDAANQRFFIISTTTGAENNFTLTADNTAGLNALKSMGLYAESEADQEQYRNVASYTDAEIQAMKDTYAAALNSERDSRIEAAVRSRTEAVIREYTNNKAAVTASEERIASYSAEIEALEISRGDLTLTQDDIDDIDARIEELRIQSEEEAAALAEAEAAVAGFDGRVAENDEGEYVLTGTELASIQEEAVAEVDAAIGNQEQEYNANLDEKIAYARSKFDADGNFIEDTDATATKIDGDDARIILNGATFISNTNNFNVNGLTIAAKAKTAENETLTLTTNTDVDGIYNSIKTFLTEYNALIKEMDTLFNAKSARGYEPLTSEEKDAMSETEIEQWETKIKDALLRRDSTLDSVSNIMKSCMQKAFTINGRNYSLASFGIKTAGYFTAGENEKGMYHIDGDPEDDTSSMNTDKLKEMISSDPDTVASFFSQLVSDLYSELGKKLNTRNELSSIFHVYNDKQMKKEYTEYSEKISKWEAYVTKQEDYWYSKFTAMEKALATLNSNTSALSSLLGGN